MDLFHNTDYTVLVKTTYDNVNIVKKTCVQK